MAAGLTDHIWLITSGRWKNYSCSATRPFPK
jgi:hypothetical protein